MAAILIAGCGYVGSVLGSQLVSLGHEVWGLRRDPGRLPDGIRPLEADLLNLQTLSAIPDGIEFVVYAASPGAGPGASLEQTRAAYRAIYLDGLANLLRALSEQAQGPRRVFFTSSTSVFDHWRGEWVDEDTKAEPSRFSGQMSLFAERLLRGGPFASTSVRFGGIYGPGRTRLLDRVRSGVAHWRSDGPHYTNRIHRDDAAAVLSHLIQHPSPQELYVGVDCEPTEDRIMLEWLADQLGAPVPFPAPFETPGEHESEAAHSVRGAGSKRCRNARLLASGYRFRYPSFRDGYAALIREEQALAQVS